MTLTLLAVSLNDKPLSQPITAHFGPEGGTIGRADHNTMALPDPERHISRLQAEIVASGNQFQIRNVGAANPISVAGRPVGAGESVPLRHGSEVRIGGYQLKVVDDASADRTGNHVTRGRAAIVAQTAKVALDAGQSNARPLTGGSPFNTGAAFGPVTPRPGPRTSGSIGFLPEVAASPLSDNNPFADLLGESPTAAATRAVSAKPAAVDPFADLMPPPSGVSAGSAASVPAPPPASRLPDDFDPMAMPAKSNPPRAPAGPAPSDDPFAGLLPSAAPSSIDQLFGLGGGAGADPLAAFMADAAPASGGPSAAPSGLSTDPLALFGVPAPAPTAATAPDQVPPLQEAFSPPRPIRPAPVELPAKPMPAPPSPARAAVSPPVAPPAPVTPPLPAPAPVPNSLFGSLFAKTDELRRGEFQQQAPMAPANEHPPTAPLPRRSEAAPAPAGDVHDREALWAAFCAGTGVPIDLPGGVSPEMMNTLGQIMINALGGTLRLMAVRANVKQEMRAHMTVIQARSNNPLKFSPDARSGLEQLLKPPMRGFLAGPEAMTDAMHDLVGHSIGTVVGMRAALEGVLQRFEPDALESKLAAKSLLDTVLPMNRKARLWELYLQHFETIRTEAQDDFQALFGKAFLAAYEQQLDRLHDEAAGGPR